MNIVELKKQIDDNTLSNLYIFTGEEHTILDIYIDKICSKFQVVKHTESVYTIYKNLTTKSLIATGNCVYVVREDKEFLSSESIWKDLNSKLSKKGITLVVKYGTLDARSKFYKQFSDSITTFEKLSDKILLKYVLKDLTVSTDYATKLINACNSDYGRILLEIDKIKQYAQYSGVSDKKAFEDCFDSHIIYMEPEGQVFDLVDCIMLRDYRNVYKLLQESRRRSDNELYILSMLHNNAKALLQIQIFGNSNMKELSNATGLNTYQINSCSKYLNRYSCEDLVKLIKYIKYCDKCIKDGTFTASFALDYLIVNNI